MPPSRVSSRPSPLSPRVFLSCTHAPSPKRKTSSLPRLPVDFWQVTEACPLGLPKSFTSQFSASPAAPACISNKACVCVCVCFGWHGGIHFILESGLGGIVGRTCSSGIHSLVLSFPGSQHPCVCVGALGSATLDRSECRCFSEGREETTLDMGTTDISKLALGPGAEIRVFWSGFSRGSCLVCSSLASSVVMCT